MLNALGVKGSYNIAARYIKKDEETENLLWTCFPTGTINTIFPARDITVLPQIAKIYFQCSV